MNAQHVLRDKLHMTNQTKNSDKNSGKGKKGKPENLTPFKPGQTGNPNGRPKGKLNYDTRVDMAIEMLAMKYVEEMNKKNKKVKGYKPMTVEDVDIEGDIFMQHLNKARAGDRHFIDSFLDRRYGKAKQPIELPGSIFNTPEYNKSMIEAEAKIKAFQDKWFKKKKTNG